MTRPTKFKTEYIEQANKLCLHGFTDSQIGEFFNVNESTINRWKIKHPEFCKSIKRSKQDFDRKVERALAERAIGYSHEETHISNYQGKITKTQFTKHYPPDVVACIYWLNNRQSEQWASRKAIDSKVTTNECRSGFIVTTEPLSMEQWLLMGQESQKMIEKSLSALTNAK
jgi:hypothetical protein